MDRASEHAFIKRRNHYRYRILQQAGDRLAFAQDVGDAAQFARWTRTSPMSRSVCMTVAIR